MKRTALLGLILVGMGWNVCAQKLSVLGTGKASGFTNEYRVMIIVGVVAPDLFQGAQQLESRTAAMVAALKKMPGRMTPECSLPMMMFSTQKRLPVISSLPLSILLVPGALNNGTTFFVQEISLRTESLTAVDKIRELAFANNGVVAIRSVLSAARESALNDVALERAVKDGMNKAKIAAAAAGIGQPVFREIEEVVASVAAEKNNSAGVEVTRTVRVVYSFISPEGSDNHGR